MIVENRIDFWIYRISQLLYSRKLYHKIVSSIIHKWKTVNDWQFDENEISIFITNRISEKKAFITQRHVLHDCYKYGEMNEEYSSATTYLNPDVIGFPEKATFSG